MPDILRRTNKNSQNLFAEALAKYLGRQLEQSGSWSLGSQAVLAFLNKNGQPAEGFTMIDGSGLARENRVTTRLITELLKLMHRSHHPHFHDSLSQAGVDGTLARRTLDLKGHVFAKTGYIRGVRALSGYIHTRSGRMLVFSIIFNNISGEVRPFEELQDEACRLLVQYPKLPPASHPTTRP